MEILFLKKYIFTVANTLVHIVYTILNVWACPAVCETFVFTSTAWFDMIPAKAVSVTIIHACLNIFANLFAIAVLPGDEQNDCCQFLHNYSPKVRFMR